MKIERLCFLVIGVLLWPAIAWAGGSADLSISLTASPQPANAGSNLTYSINIFNNGPTTVATGVMVTSKLPQGVTFVSATPTRGTCSGETEITCNIGTLTVGGGVAVAIVVRPEAAGVLASAARVRANEPDPDPSNNRARAVTPVRMPSPRPSMLDPKLSVRTAVEGLAAPTGIAFLGPDDFLVLEKATGNVRRVVQGTVQKPVLTLPVNFASERGLLGIALHPNFAENGLVYLYWTCRGPAAGEDCEAGPPTDDLARVPLLGNRVDRFIWNGESLTLDQNLIRLRALQADADQSGVFNQPLRGNHDGGRIVFGPDDKLYILIGDVGRRGWLQNLRAGTLPNGRDDQFGGPEPDDAHLTGVILRLNDDGSAPRDNPFFRVGGEIGGQVGANIQKIFAYGIRNGFGMAFDPFTGQLWNQENGDDSFSEINRVEAGFNGGWVQTMGPVMRVAEYKAIETSPRYFGLQQVRWPPTLIADSPAEIRGRLFMLPGARYTDPAFSWKYEIAPAGIGFVAGQGLGSDFEGDLFVGGAVPVLLGGQLWRFRLSDDRLRFVFNDPRLEDRVADNFDKYDLTESESLLIGTDFGVVTDIQTGPNGRLLVVSLSNGAIYEISAKTP